MNLDIAPYMVGGSAFLAGLLALSLLRQAGLAPRLLALALLAALANILHGNVVAAFGPPPAGWMVEPLQMLLPPLFAAYVLALLDPGWRLRRRHWLHFLPALAASGLAALPRLVPAGLDSLPVAPALVSALFWFALLGQALAYVGMAMRAIKRYRRRLREAVSTLAGVDQSWLWWYSLALHFLYLTYALVPAILLHSGHPEAARHLVGGSLCAAVVILAAHQLLAKRGTVLGQEAGPPPAGTPAPPPGSGATAAPPSPYPQTDDTIPAPPAWDPELPAALAEAMEGRRLFLNPGLGLVELAEALGWPRNEVSAAINGHFGMSFYDFVNGYRVAEAKSLMLDPAKRGFTLVALAMDAGFNSKPTFNAVFKKTTGLAPTAWLAAQDATGSANQAGG